MYVNVCKHTWLYELWGWKEAKINTDEKRWVLLWRWRHSWQLDPLTYNAVMDVSRVNPDFFSFYRPHPFNVYSLWFHMAQFGAESFFDEKMAPAYTAPRLYCALLCCCNTHEWNLGYTGVSNWNKIKMGGEVGWGALPPFPVNQLSCQFSVRETPGDKHSSDSSFKLKMERCLETKTRSPSSCLLWTTSDWQVCML